MIVDCCRGAEDDVRGPEVVRVDVLHGGDAPVCSRHDPVLVDRLAGVRGGTEVLVAVLDPTDGKAEGDRVQRSQDVLGVDAELEAEAPADVGGDHPYRTVG